MFKTKDVLNSLEQIISSKEITTDTLEQIISPKEITTDTLALELTNVISGKGNICFEKTDIEIALKNSSECDYNILTKSNDDKITLADILNNKDAGNIKTLILVIKHNGSLSLFKMSELMNNIIKNMPNKDIELLIGDYIDKNTNEIKLTTIILKETIITEKIY